MKIRNDFHDYLNKSLSANQILERYQGDDAGYAILVYLTLFREKVDIATLEREGWNNVKSNLDKVINFVFIKFNNNDQDYIRKFSEFETAGYAYCVLNPDDPLLNSAKVRTLSFDKAFPTEEALYVKALRFASQISLRMLDTYLSELRNNRYDTTFKLGEEIQYWDSKANICDFTTGLERCLDEIRTYVVKNIDEFKKKSDRNFLCLVGVAEDGVVQTVRL